MIRKSATSDAIDVQISLSHIRLLLAFLAGVFVCFTIIYYRSKPEYDYHGDWDDFVGHYNYIPALSDNEIQAIQQKFDKSAECLKTPEHPDGCAYATLITNDEFLELALVLGESIRASGSLYPFIALVSDKVSPRGIEILNRAGLRVQKLEPITLPMLVQPWREYWKTTYVKLRMWGMDTYERIVYIDADSIVMKNVDALFREHGDYLAATDRHLCKHELEPGMTSMVAVLWPEKKIEDGLFHYLNESGYTFSRGDQAVTELFFERRRSMKLLNESWSSFVFRCQCDDFISFVGQNQSPKTVHFTGWFRPHITSSGVSIPVGLSAKARECGKSYYDHWETLWHKVIERQSLTVEEWMKENVRPIRG